MEIMRSGIIAAVVDRAEMQWHLVVLGDGGFIRAVVIAMLISAMAQFI